MAEDAPSAARALRQASNSFLSSAKRFASSSFFRANSSNSFSLLSIFERRCACSFLSILICALC